MKKLEGKVAVITGGNSGIGLATARKFAEHGAKVVISGRDPKTLEKAAREIGGDTLAIRADVADTTEAVHRLGLPGASVYSASKAALCSLARTLSAELIERGIRVNGVAPGPVETPIMGRLGLSPEAVQEMAQGLLSRVPVKRFGRPEDIAEAVLFLASPDSAYVVGVELNVDGGMSQL